MSTAFGNNQSRAAAFQGVREAHQREITEDYVELIDDLITSKGEARAVDLAHCLGVSQATVNKTLQRLQRDGFITTEPYRAVFLSQAGQALANWSRQRHQLVLDFLLALGVSPETAHLDAEGMEHHISDETRRAFEQFLAQRRENSDHQER